MPMIMPPIIVRWIKSIACQFDFDGSHFITRDGDEGRFVISVFIGGGDQVARIGVETFIDVHTCQPHPIQGHTAAHDQARIA